MSREAAKLYSGTFERTVDAKKRVSVPAAWLNLEEDEPFHIVPHPVESYLMVMPPAEFDLWEQRIQESDLSPAEKRMAIRKFYSEAYQVNTDKQGRILLNEKHCERAGLNGEVIFIGARSRFEIWSKSQYTVADEKGTDAYKRAAEAIGL